MTKQIEKRIPFVLIHISMVLVFTVPFSWLLVVICLLSTYFRLFGITAGFHRYFSHRSFKTSRWFQFILALIGTTAAQLGPLWWAAHHRHHHRFSDTKNDTHSPVQNGFFHAHFAWLFEEKNKTIQTHYINDLLRFPELNFIERFYYGFVALYAVFIYGLGYLVESSFPQSQLTAYSIFIYGFLLSTVFLYHLTFSINSLMHLVGKRVYQTTDDSRNHFLLALLTLGEAWHNNHHRYPLSERQGFTWWQIDITHYILKFFEKLGLIWDIKTPPKIILIEGGYA